MPNLSPLVEAFDGLVLDLDGTVYIGDAPIRHAVSSLNACRSHFGTKLTYATNNASRTPEEVTASLRGFDLPVESTDVLTSAQVASAMLAEDLPAGSPVLVVGGMAIAEALAAEGLSAVWSSEEAPVAVVQGFHPDVGWRNLAFGAAAVNRGIPWVATNRDLTIPTAFGIAPGNGTLVNAVCAATGRQPVVAGKPEAAILRLAAKRMGSSNPLVVGDRLNTDIAAAHAAAMKSLLVLTGVSGASDLCSASVIERPDYFGSDLRSLLQPPRVAEIRAGVVHCQGWIVELDQTGIKIIARGTDTVAGITALANGAWLALDQNGRCDSVALAELEIRIAAARGEL